MKRREGRGGGQKGTGLSPIISRVMMSHPVLERVVVDSRDVPRDDIEVPRAVPRLSVERHAPDQIPRSTISHVNFHVPAHLLPRAYPVFAFTPDGSIRLPLPLDPHENAILPAGKEGHVHKAMISSSATRVGGSHSTTAGTIARNALSGCDVLDVRVCRGGRPHDPLADASSMTAEEGDGKHNAPPISPQSVGPGPLRFIRPLATGL